MPMMLPLFLLLTIWELFQPALLCHFTHLSLVQDQDVWPIKSAPSYHGSILPIKFDLNCKCRFAWSNLLTTLRQHISRSLIPVGSRPYISACSWLWVTKIATSCPPRASMGKGEYQPALGSQTCCDNFTFLVVFSLSVGLSSVHHLVWRNGFQRCASFSQELDQISVTSADEQKLDVYCEEEKLNRRGSKLKICKWKTVYIYAINKFQFLW